MSTDIVAIAETQGYDVVEIQTKAGRTYFKLEYIELVEDVYCIEYDYRGELMVVFIRADEIAEVKTIRRDGDRVVGTVLGGESDAA